MAIFWRHSALAQRHAEIGGELEDWNGMGTAWFYDHTPERAIGVDGFRPGPGRLPAGPLVTRAM